MVGIVIVSHSRLLADGVKELAEQMTQGKVPLAAAGGIDDEANPIGTDPMAVMAAIEEMADLDGILVLMDLGSALMSAETALDFIDEDLKAKVRLCAAPIVEGTMAAAVQASVGTSLKDVEAEAMTALAAKAEQLAPLTGDTETESEGLGTPDRMDGDGISATFVVANPMGLHARPAASLVSCAGQFESQVTIEKGGRVVSARSINQVATLAVKCGDEIVLTASGSDAEAAIEALTALHADHFGEDINQAAPPLSSKPETVAPAAEDGTLQGIGASKGMAAGKAMLYQPSLPEIKTHGIGDVNWEIDRLEEALVMAITDIGHLASGAAKEAGKANAAIFDVHRLILEDPDLKAQATARIETERINAEAAWYDVVKALSDTYANLEDAYMKERAADVMDAGGRVLRHLVGETGPSLDLSEPGIVVAHDLLPSDVAGLDPEKVLAMVCEVGGQTSHAAILARGLGIPAVVGAASALLQVSEGEMLVVDGESGRVELAPDAQRVSHVMRKREAWLAEEARIREEGMDPAITVDGVHLHVAANIGIPTDATRAFEFGAEGVGLFRTEFLFQERDEAPSEAEQVEAYTAAARAMSGHPVIIRTLDVGGDKPLSYVSVPKEENPFLGERGVRLCLNRPELFKPQLRALLLASQQEKIKIMVPMIAHPDELLAVKALLAQCAEELRGEGKAIEGMPKLGIMIEVPSAVAMADQLAKEADFFSIGTNDLTQYVMAADRGNAQVSELSDSFHPAVIRMVEKTVAAAAKVGIPVGMCGELAGRVEATPLLLGLGLDELSMSAPSIPHVKATLRELSRKGCREIAEKAMTFGNGAKVRELLRQI